MVTSRRIVVALVISMVLGLLSAGPTLARSTNTATVASGCTLTATEGTVTRFVGPRSYHLYVPPGLSGPQAPLLLSLHGASQPALLHAIDTDWRQFAATHDFIVAFPSGILHFWNFQENSFDVAFLRQVVADISATWCINPDRVHAEGHSRGAVMALRLACDAADTFASASAYAGASPAAFGQTCSPSRTIGVGIFHGADDLVVSSALGEQARDEWIARNGCASIPVSEPVSDGELLRYAPCEAGVEVWWRLYPGQGHLWPTGERGEDILNRMWAFFGANPRP